MVVLEKNAELCTNNVVGVLREVMQACRSSDPEARYAASVMTRNMQDLSEDENSPLHQMSLIQVVIEMDAAERAFNIGISDCRYSPCWFKQRPPN